MGIEIEREHFTREEHAQFSRRLHENLQILRELSAQPSFGAGEPTIGAEVEMHLVDAAAQPACVGPSIRPRVHDPRCTLEIDAFNLEINSNPQPLAGEPFRRLGSELEELLGSVTRAAADEGARVLLAGTLPTLTVDFLRGPVLSDSIRYRALSEALRQERGAAFSLHIEGRETLLATCDDVTLEGANASLQVHLRVAPRDFPAIYNAAQLAAAPLLAVTGNSPYFDGKDLWDETRIALFKQATDTRLDEHGRLGTPARVSFGHGFIHDPMFLFEQNVALYEPLLPVLSRRETVDGVPALDELRLHQGTIWSWNRAVYDPAQGGHLRLEHRVVASGPSPIDMLANIAFTLGLTLGLAPRMAAWLPGMPFIYAERNLYRAAKYGLAAELAWPNDHGVSPRLRNARELVFELVALAQSALLRHGVDAAEVEDLLDIIRQRALTRCTGAEAQRRLVARYERDLPRSRALARMVEDYLALSESGLAVHRWRL